MRKHRRTLTARLDSRFAGRSSCSLMVARAAGRLLLLPGASLSDGSPSRGPSRSSTERRFGGDAASIELATTPLLRLSCCLASLQGWN